MTATTEIRRLRHRMVGFSKPHLVEMDLKFKRHMLACIKGGHERAEAWPLGVVTAPGTVSPKWIRAEPVVTYRSSAALLAEMGRGD
jgi:hypothetical protein